VIGGFPWGENAIADQASPHASDDYENLSYRFVPRFFHWAAPAALVCSGMFPAGPGTGASEVEVASFIKRHTDAREMRCLRASGNWLSGRLSFFTRPKFASAATSEVLTNKGKRRLRGDRQPVHRYGRRLLGWTGSQCAGCRTEVCASRKLGSGRAFGHKED
jgi:hypothetical protein